MVLAEASLADVLATFALEVDGRGVEAFLLQLRLGFRRNSFHDGPRIEAEPLT
jgi:hypothetical protein